MINNTLYKKIVFSYLLDVDFMDKFTLMVKESNIVNDINIDKNINNCYICKGTINVSIYSVLKNRNISSMYLKCLCNACKKQHMIDIAIQGIDKTGYNSFFNNLVSKYVI